MTNLTPDLRNDLSALEQKLGPIEYRPVESLARYENNPRKHSGKQLAKLTASICEFGFTIPVLVDEEGTIIAGEARVEAAKRAGLLEVPVIAAHQWSAAQVRAYRLADNRLAELGEWDQGALAIEFAAIIELDDSPMEVLGWGTAEIDLILDDGLEDAKACAPDPADEQIDPPALPVNRFGDLWLLGEHRLLCGSSLDPDHWISVLGGQVAAMVFTDPRGNVAIPGHADSLSRDNHTEFAMASDKMTAAESTTLLSDYLAAILPHLKDGAVLDLCMDWHGLGEMLDAIESNELSLLDLCVWNKNSGGMGGLYRSQHELVFVAKKGKAAHANTVELGMSGRCRANVWDYAGISPIGKTCQKNLKDHPLLKPVELVADAIRDVCGQGEIVLDGFMGSGTTILACEKTGRRAYGIEIEPQYVDVAIARWETMTGEPAVLACNGHTFAEVKAERFALPVVSSAEQPLQPTS